MAGDFITMVTRIASELRRSNLNTEIKAAINDAIFEGSSQRFYFNEMRGLSFPTVVGQESYADLGITEIDSMYYLIGATRYDVWPRNNNDMNMIVQGNNIGGQLEIYSRYGLNLRLYPLPGTIQTIYLDGYGRMTPYPLVNDADTNTWMVDGEKYIRNLAKSIVLRDVVRDFGEASVYENLAEDRKNDLLLISTSHAQGANTMRGTDF